MSAFNIRKPSPTMGEVLDLLRSEIMMSLNCHAVGTVQSFNSTEQTVVAKMNYQKTFVTTGLDNSEYNVDYPIVSDCPVVIMGGGTATLTFPIAAGDQCLILFNDRDIDNWFAGSYTGGPATNRLHSFADCIAIVGLHSLANSLSGYDTTRAVLRNGDTMVGVSASKIKIANATKTLKQVLQDLTLKLETFSSGLGVGNLAAQAATLNAALLVVDTEIGALLE